MELYVHVQYVSHSVSISMLNTCTCMYMAYTHVHVRCVLYGFCIHNTLINH